MADNQVAVGIFWNWNTSHSDVPILAVFECSSGTCTGQSEGAGGYTFDGMQVGPTAGFLPLFNGTGSLSEVPVPAAAWLFGTGLLGLVGVARRKACV